MEIISKAKSVIKSSDMFCSKQFFRYKTVNQYKTVTGGLVTLTVFITIFVCFASMVLETLARTNISYDTVTHKNSDPMLTTIKTGGGSKFMFGVRVMPQNQESGTANSVFNLTDSRRYFDITFLSSVLQSGNFVGYTPIPLQKCTRQHWNDFPNILNDYDKMQINKWLCPPINATFDLQGQYSSSISKMGIISVTACNNYSNINAFSSVCASPQQISEYFAKYSNILFGYLFSNPVINPGQTGYIDYYLESLSQAIFSETLGSDNLINYADYEIDTDSSIWPFASRNKEVGVIMDGNMQSRPLTKTVSSFTYLRMMLFKSSTSLKINRTVQKISSTFSYIGGFFGAIATTLFVLKFYTDHSLELSLVKEIFKMGKELRENKFVENFNLFKFFMVKVYDFLKFWKIPIKWAKGDCLKEYQQEIKNQLDVSFMLKRLLNLEKLMTVILGEDQFRELHLHKRLSIQNIKLIHNIFGYTKNKLGQPQIESNDSDSNNGLQLKEKIEELQKSSKDGYPMKCQRLQTMLSNKKQGKILKENELEGQANVQVDQSLMSDCRQINPIQAQCPNNTDSNKIEARSKKQLLNPIKGLSRYKFRPIGNDPSLDASPSQG